MLRRKHKPLLVIVMEGGVVQDICTTNQRLAKQFDIRTVDYDVDGTPDSDLTVIPQDDNGDISAAAVGNWSASKLYARVAKALRA